MFSPLNKDASITTQYFHTRHQATRALLKLDDDDDDAFTAVALG